MFLRILFGATAALQAAALPVTAGEYFRADEPPGTIHVIDGDTLDVDGERFRLSGIDAPERKQVCLREGMAWSCGQAATEALRAKVRDERVHCVGIDRDRYGRTVAMCSLNDGTDLNGWMVERGWAMAYRQYARTYVIAEEQARAARRGIWDAEFSPPWNWRADQRKAAKARKKPPPQMLPLADR